MKDLKPKCDLDTYKNMLGRTEKLLKQLCSNLETYGSEGNEHKITIYGNHKNTPSGFSYGVPDYILDIIINALYKYIAELKDIIDYYNRHAAWIINQETFPSYYTCGHCGCFNFHKSDYCPHCGFVMDMEFDSNKARQLYEKIRLEKLKTKDKNV